MLLWTLSVITSRLNLRWLMASVWNMVSFPMAGHLGNTAPTVTPYLFRVSNSPSTNTRGQAYYIYPKQSLGKTKKDVASTLGAPPP